MLSFGHAVYYGLGGYLAVHAMKAIVASCLAGTVAVDPIWSAGSPAFSSAAIFGWVSTKRSGTAFAMISLGLAELIGSSALILRGFFGGEEGITADRTKLFRIFDWNFGPQIQVYYLIAAWCLLCAFLMYALTRTPLGRMCNAVRDNPERVQFVGYDPRMVRFLAFCLSGLFAGVAGALAAINFEIANSALFSAVQSGIVLLATFMGGARLLRRTGPRRNSGRLSAAHAQRLDRDLAALLRAPVHRDGDVRAIGSCRAHHDAPAAMARRHAAQGAARPISLC